MLSNRLAVLLKPQATISLQTILQTAGTSSFGFILALLALPSALPIPAPGYSMPFGGLIIFFGIQLLFNRRTPWTPIAWKTWHITLPAEQKSLNKILRFITFIEKFVKTRFRQLFVGAVPFIALVITLCGVSMLIPIPGTNTLPALGVFLLALGLLEEDGLLAIAGLLVALIGISITVLLLFMGKEALQLLIGFW